MDNNAKFFLSEAKDRITETEAQLYLIQHWIEKNEDLVLKNALNVLEDCIKQTYKAISRGLGGLNEHKTK